jgi:formylmethanofuran dehydrogenase subunit E
MVDARPGDIIQAQGLAIRVLGWKDIEEKFSDLICSSCGRKLNADKQHPVKQGKVFCNKCAKGVA